LHKVHAPARTYVNAQLRHAAPNWLYVTHQTQSQTFNARGNNPTHSFIGQVIKPRSEFGKRFDQVHRQIVIERLQAVKALPTSVNDS
jgi:hypothetical protein